MDSHTLHEDANSFDCPYCQLSEHDWSLVFDPSQLPPAPPPSRLQHILIGHPEDVNREILNLYHCGYALDSWSSPQRLPGSLEVITGYSKQSIRLSGWSDR